MGKDGVPAIPYLWKGPAQVLKKTFKLLDADGSGTISDDEGYAAGRALHAGSVDAGRKYWDTMKGNLDADGSGTIEMEEYINVQVRYFMENGLEPTPTMGALQEAYNKLEEGHARQMQQGTPRNDPPPAKAPSETPAAE